MQISRTKIPSFWFLGLSIFALLIMGMNGLSASEEPEFHIEELTDELPVEMRENLIISEGDANPPFEDGDLFHYKLGWGIFSVARSTLQTNLVEFDNESAWHISLATRTNGFADAFYKVRNFSQTWLTRDVRHSMQYLNKQHEGKTHRDVTLQFDWDNKSVVYHNVLDDDLREPVMITAGTFDPLSIVFFVRTLDFELNDKLVIPTTNGKEFFYTVIRVVDKVERKFGIGKREAWVLKPDIKDLGGVFKKSDKGEVVFYFSTDEQKLPLRMESEVSVGRFWAELQRMEKAETPRTRSPWEE